MKLANGPLEPLGDWFDEMIWDRLPEMPLGGWFRDIVDWAKVEMDTFFDWVAANIEAFIDNLTWALLLLPSLLMVVLFAGVSLWIRGWRFGLTMFVAMTMVAWTPFWGEAMETLSMVLVSSAMALLIAIPVGILAAENDTVGRLIRPVLDFMQTMPAFVYLIPAVAVLGIGAVPGAVATVVFCMPPGIRLTALGLRQVDKEVVEAGESFGASPRMILARIKLPLALPTIMAGVNQVIMLSLSMVVIAGMVGADGLGKVILNALNNVDLARSFNAGLAVVVVAIFLDRITDSLSSKSKVARVQQQMRESS